MRRRVLQADPLIWLARQGRFVLVAGLVAGLALPGLAGVLRPLVPQIVALLLFLAAVRIGRSVFDGAFRALPLTLGVVLALQLVLPLAVLGLAAALGHAHHAVALALVMMCAAPAIVGAPNICLMLGAPPQFAMRLLVVGTALLPLTVLPVFWFLPELGAPGDVFAAALRLLVMILLATGAGFALRHWLWRSPGDRALARLDGVSALVLAVFVIGLMPALSTALREGPWGALGWLVLALTANFGAQLLGRLVLARQPDGIRLPVSVIAGNRNIALFLVALPADVMAPVMVFIGCYQIPMFLTPLVMRRRIRAARL